MIKQKRKKVIWYIFRKIVVRDNKIDNVKVVFMKKIRTNMQNKREELKTDIKDY